MRDIVRPQTVSRALSAAGHKRATFRRNLPETSGFLVQAVDEYLVRVYYRSPFRSDPARRDSLRAYAKTLEAAGYEVTPSTPPPDFDRIVVQKRRH